MNEGVKILLERIKTNPEEFEGSNPKWNVLINAYKGILDPEDREALENAINGLMQQRFTETVMKQLLAPEEDDSLGKSWYTAQKIGTPRGGATLVRSSSAFNQTNALVDAQNTTLHELLHMKAQQELEIQKREHTTLFGRLKNYLAPDE
jgi:hypothetical protein